MSVRVPTPHCRALEAHSFDLQRVYVPLPLTINWHCLDEGNRTNAVRYGGSSTTTVTHTAEIVYSKSNDGGTRFVT